MSESLSHIANEFVKKVKEFIKEQEKSEEKWDINRVEEFLRPVITELGREIINELVKRKAEEAEKQVVKCKCEKMPSKQRQEKITFYTTYGEITVETGYYYCNGCGHGDNPFRRLTGVRGKWRSRILERALVDFGSEESFEKAHMRLEEHYGISIGASTIRAVTEEHGRQAMEFIDSKLEEAMKKYEGSSCRYGGIERLIVECDGSDVRTGELREMTEEEIENIQKEGLPLTQKSSSKIRRKRETKWREVRLISTLKQGEVEAKYLATMEDCESVGKKMFGLALLHGMGEKTFVHGLGDGAPWIADQFKTNFPNGRFLLDRYHLIENIYKGAEGLGTTNEKIKKRWVNTQVERIDKGLIDRVLKECEKKAGGNKDSPMNGLIRYIKERMEYLDYQKAQEDGLPVGSGVVESGHKHVVQKRLKLPGTWWKEENVNPMLALRVIRANYWWEDYWKNINVTN